jgi:spore coat protein U-like protein
MHWGKAMTTFRRAQSESDRRVQGARRSRQTVALRGIFAATLAITAQQAWSAQCSLSTQGVNFGSYDVFSNTSLDSTGNIAVTCDVDAAYSISLSPGGGTYASRSMVNGPHLLNYNLYTDATRAAIWGDGTGGTGIVSGSGTTANHTVYGRISARQNAYTGSYSDSITVIADF